MTNFDKELSEMTIEKMAKDKAYLTYCDECPIRACCNKFVPRQTLVPLPECSDVWKSWLESEVEE